MMKLMKTSLWTIGSLGIFIAGFLVGNLSMSDENDGCSSVYQFINTDITCGDGDVIKKTGYKEFESQLIKFIDATEDSGRVTESAIYFRDLEHGPTFSINEFAEFVPASLLKLPLAFVFLAGAEEDPEILNVELEYRGESTAKEQFYIPTESAEPNRLYTVEELLRLMLVYSDNASYEMLEAKLGGLDSGMSLRTEVFQELGIIDPETRREDTLTVRAYASLFRILYNTSYLNPELSEKVLSWLAESDFNTGLVAGVPKGMAVSHKFGERFLDDGTKQLHDCGVIYYPENPYLLCVMTKGSEWSELESVISEISRMVYEEVDSRRIQ